MELTQCIKRRLQVKEMVCEGITRTLGHSGRGTAARGSGPHTIPYQQCRHQNQINNMRLRDPFSLIVAKGNFGESLRSMATSMIDQSGKKKCLGVDCENDAGPLQCPTCLKTGIKDSFFCSQDCFKRNWVCLPLCACRYSDRPLKLARTTTKPCIRPRKAKRRMPPNTNQPTDAITHF